jgi:hypothetical protein
LEKGSEKAAAAAGPAVAYPTAWVPTTCEQKTVEETTAHGKKILVKKWFKKQTSIKKRNAKGAAAAAATATETGTATECECVEIPKSDASFNNFAIIMAVVLSCIFVAFFVVFFFCTKDLFLEILNKSKYGLEKVALKK